ncbi:MAG TPA: PsbP-related protein [Patescibacteria group bacterium]|nr:PsbP-related protein [Patescibacteria group bacterium]
MKKIAVIILIILASVVAFSGYFYYRWIQFNNFSPISGSWPYAEVGDEREQQTNPPLLPELGQIKGGKVFTSSDNNFQFRYPEDWVLSPQNPRSKTDKKELVELWQLTSYQPSTVKKTDLPQGSVQMDLEIINNADNQDLAGLFPCDSLEIMECREVKINSIVYRRTITKLRSGGQVITLATIRDNRIYKVTAYPAPGEEEAKAVEEVQTIFNTFRFSP